MATSTPPTERSSQRGQFAGFRQVLTNRHFLLLWLAQLISQTILNAANFGLVVLVQNTTRSEILVSLAIVAFLLPAIPFSALAGVMVDRMNKRRVLWVSNILRVGTMLLIFVSLLYNQTLLFPLFVLIFLTSLIGQFFTPAEGASIPLLVGKEELMPALSLFNITITLAQAIGYLLLGRVVATIFPPFTLAVSSLHVHIASIDMLFVIVAALYGICTILILCIPKKAFVEQQQQWSQSEHGSFDFLAELKKLWHDSLEIWRVIRVDKILFFSVIQLSLAGVIMQLIGSLSPTFVQQVLLRPAEDMSIILSPAAVSLISTAALLPRINNKVSKTRLTILGLVVMGIGFLLFPAVELLAWGVDRQHWSQSPLLFWLVLAVVFGLGIGMALMNIPAQTLVQEHAPEEKRAGVLSLQFMLFSAGSIPVLLFSGTFAQFIGLNPLIILIALSLLLTSWWSVHYIRARQ